MKHFFACILKYVIFHRDACDIRLLLKTDLFIMKLLHHGNCTRNSDLPC
jgi:hypothetical protein